RPDRLCGLSGALSSRPPSTHSFSSCASVHRPTPPPSPTRRSSDLHPFVVEGDLQHRLAHLAHLDVGEQEVPDVPAALGVGLDPRSEEHTSELQSPFDLVCRRLLENKKMKPML